MKALLLGLALLAGPAAADEAKVSRFFFNDTATTEIYTERVTSSFYFKARDGVRLAMDVHRPAVNGKPVEQAFPVVWQHSVARRFATDQKFSGVAQMPLLTQYGYVVVEVDRRGAGASFGSRRGYNDRTEARDAYEITEWLARQPWSTGKVGVYGCSNTGDAAMHAVSLMPPSLKAVFAGCFSWSKYDGFLRGGIFAQWGSGVDRSFEDDLRNQPVDGDEDRTLLRQAAEDHRTNTPLASLWRGMPYRDSWSDLVGTRFWAEGSSGTYRAALARSGVAFYIFGGWEDDFRREGLVAMANLATNPRKYVIGPWQHCRNPGFDLLVEAHRFFDHWLKGIANGVMQEPAYTYSTQGTGGDGRWSQSNQWPPVGTQAVVQQLRVEGRGATQHLVAASAKQPRTASVSLSVAAPIACPAGWSPLAPTCLQSDNGLRFEGQALTRDTELTGHPVLRLWVSSTEPDPHVFAYLEDVDAEGRATLVTDGRLKASLRAVKTPPYDFLGLPWTRSLEEDHQPLQPGVPVELKFDLLPLSHVFRAGHHWRLTVTGSDPRDRRPVQPGAQLTVHADVQHPSALQLPFATAPPGGPRVSP